MINRTILVGRLTKDPEVKYTQSNIPFARFTLAVNRTFTGPTGEREADFIQCVACQEKMNVCCSISCKEISTLPAEDQRELRKGLHNSNKIFKKGRSKVLKFKQ